MGSDITVTDQFCGAGGSSIGATRSGMTLKLALNHWARAIETHNANFPHALHDCTDISACDPRRYPSTDILLTSPECFPSGTLILAKRGLIPIEQIVIGDEVLTHMNRWRHVTSVMTSTSSTLIIKGSGHPGLEVTPSHPFWARKYEILNRNKRIIYPPEWCKASSLCKGMLWASPILNENICLPIPEVTGRGTKFCNEFWWMIGKWLADGIVTTKANKNKQIRISCSHAEVEETYLKVNFNPPQSYHSGSGEYKWSREIRDRQVLLTTCHNGLSDWLLSNFGEHAWGKRIPTWALTMPVEWRRSLLDGYLFGDGTYCPSRRQHRFATVSKSLAIGIRLLAISLGHNCNLCLKKGGTKETLNGIEFTRKAQYTGAFVDGGIQTSFIDGYHRWFRVEEVSSGHENIAVYNISVDEDESYVADGIVVHNCTNHSLAKGKNKKTQWQPDLFGKETIDPSEERSRATMFDVCRFAEFHNYNLIVVENVVDARQWIMWEAWLHAMDLLGYNHKCVYFNSMHAWPTPQSRDRMYVVFWKKKNRAPDLDFRPLAHCPTCEKNVGAVQMWKNTHRAFGRYRSQYVYVCPDCHKVIEPYYYCAANAIDWSLPSPKIGDRPRPLKEATIERIRVGLAKFARKNVPLITDLAYTHSFDPRSYPVTGATPTQTARQTQSLIVPPFIAELHNNSTAREITEPLATFCAGGGHHGLVVPPLLIGNYSPGWARPVTEPTGSITTVDHHALLTPAWLMSYYGTGGESPVENPVPTVTTKDRHALVVPPFLLSYYTRLSGIKAAITGVDQAIPTQPTWPLHYVVEPNLAIEPEDCGFRMLQPHEIQDAMAFPADYIVTGNGREKVRQLGNAVTPPVMQMILERCVQSLS